MLKLLESTFKYIPADKGLNFIICREYKETFINVYEVVIAGKHIIAECVDMIGRNPVIKINIEYNNNTYDTLFVLKEGEDNIIFNPATLRHGNKILQTEKRLLEEMVDDGIVITEVIEEDITIDIEKYKKDALKLIGENYIDKKSKIEDLKAGLVSLIEKNLSDIRSASVTDINTIKTQLHESVIEQVNNYKIDTDASITEINNIRENVLTTVDLYVDNIKQVVSDKTEALTSLQESVIYSINDKIAELDITTENHRKEIEAAFTGLSQLADNSSVKITGLVGEIYEDASKAKQTTIDELNVELVNVTASVNLKLQDLQSKADKKISSISKLVESKISELQTEKDKTHVELVSAKNELVNSLQEAIKTFETETADKTASLLEIKHQVLEQVKLQTDTINAVVNENKQEIQTLTEKITEAVEEKIKKINLVATKKEDLAQLKKQLEQRIDAESANIKKVVASYGGGSVAVQYANGGTMNGSLNVATGQILSGGIDLYNIFSTTGASGYQTIAFNESNAQLTIAPNGNTISLSALSGGNAGPSGEPLFESWAQTYSANYESTYSTMLGNSANWDNTYSTVQTYSAAWGTGGDPQTLSFNESNALLTISDGNTISLSALSSSNTGPSGEPLFESWSQTYSANYESTYSTVFTNSATKWNYQGTDIKSLTGNWQNTYSTVSSTSGSWSQTLSFDNAASTLTITPYGNTINIAGVASGRYLPLSGGSLTGALSTNHDIEITDAIKGIILKSPNGTKYRVTVSDAGELTTTLI